MRAELLAPGVSKEALQGSELSPVRRSPEVGRLWHDVEYLVIVVPFPRAQGFLLLLPCEGSSTADRFSSWVRILPVSLEPSSCVEEERPFCVCFPGRQRDRNVNKQLGAEVAIVTK